MDMCVLWKSKWEIQVFSSKFSVFFYHTITIPQQRDFFIKLWLANSMHIMEALLL